MDIYKIISAKLGESTFIYNNQESKGVFIEEFTKFKLRDGREVTLDVSPENPQIITSDLDTKFSKENIIERKIGIIIQQKFWIKDFSYQEKNKVFVLNLLPADSRAMNTDNYISTDIINQLESANKTFPTTVLTELCREINVNYKHNNLYSLVMLQRAILDHVPPFFNSNNFQSVVANYGWGKSNKNLIEKLESSLRNVADKTLHQKVREKEVLLTLEEVDFRAALNSLLGEVVRISMLSSEGTTQLRSVMSILKK